MGSGARNYITVSADSPWLGGCATLTTCSKFVDVGFFETGFGDGYAPTPPSLIVIAADWAAAVLG